METSATSATDNQNEFYRKYLIQLNLNAGFFYGVWGTDMSEEEHPDYLLLDHQDRILLVTAGEQLLPLITQGGAKLFDADNLTAWIQSLTDFTPDAAHDLDYMGSILRSELRQEQILNSPSLTKELIDFINLYGDYAYSLDDDFLVGLHRKPQIRLFFDYCYDTYFWTIPPAELERRQASYLKKFRFAKFKSDMLRMLTVFIDHCSIVH
ncbi:hypothetical protein ACFQ4C_17850 [Larkinella insperata]|uniref:Uncharacterized protein n=1 Tax=Larkinella insperata TaxID=332158 RepID=A0ABW3QD68_9BACT|nr:hypothetical protein [Larkinella insperata]